MICRVEEEIGQDLPIGARIAVDHQALRHVDRQGDRRLLQHRPQAGDDLVGGLAQAELPAFRMRAVHRHLLEGLDQFPGAMQVRHQLLGCVARGPDEFLQLRAAQLAIGSQLGLEHFRAAREAGRDRQADADRVVHFMGDTGDQAAKRRQTFRVDQVLLGGVQFEQGALGLLLGIAQLVLGLALGDGVFAEYLHRARHRADLVRGIRALHAPVVIARGDRAHRRHDLMQGQPDAQRDQDARGEDDAKKNHGDGHHPAGYIGQRPIECLLRFLLALPHLDRQSIDGADGVGLAGVDGIAQELGPAREFLG